MKRTILYSLVTLALSACAGPNTRHVDLDPAAVAREEATQRRLVAENELRQDVRIYSIADRIMRSGVELCGAKVGKALGLYLDNYARHVVLNGSRQMIRGWREAYADVYHLDRNNRPTIIYVPPDTPAAKAGLTPGDVILAINGQPVRAGKKSAQKALKIIRSRLEDNGNIIVLSIARGDQILDVDVYPVDYCQSPVTRIVSSEVNAFADGKAVYIYDGMVRFTKSDAELALVIGHEIAHNAKLHIEKQQQNMLGGALLGAVIDIVAAAYGANTGGKFAKAAANAAARVYSIEFEQEADYVGLYLAARAGFDVTQAPQFWRRMATVNPDAISFARTHPTTATRFLTLEKVVAEIRTKRALNVALIPDLEGAEGTPDRALAARDVGSGPAAALSSNRASEKMVDRSLVPKTDPQPFSIGNAALEQDLASLAPASAGDFRLILGAYRSQENLDTAWRVIKIEHGDLLGDLERTEVRADDKTIELSAGPVSDPEQAEALCAELEKRRQYCQVQRVISDGQSAR